MRQLVFALQFRGSAGPVPGTEGKLRAQTSASDQAMKTALAAGGIQATIDSAGGGSAQFESEVQIAGEGTFVESGRIAYGAAGALSFRTVGQGVIGPSGVEGLQRGAVIWEVVRGEGKLAGATGLITSNFSVGSAGEVVDNQFAQLFLP